MQYRKHNFRIMPSSRLCLQNVLHNNVQLMEERENLVNQGEREYG
jgi:hypothetical protein